MRYGAGIVLFLVVLCSLCIQAGAATRIDMDSVRADLKILRNLDFKNPVPWELKNKEDLKKEYKKDMEDEENKEEMEKGKAFLDWMELVPPKFDIVAFLSTFLSERIAGFYDTKTKKFYLCKDKSEMELPGEIKSSDFDEDKITAIHEMDHALQDQYFDLTQIHKVMKDSKNDDAYYAIKTLVEGDATYVTIDAIYKQMNVDLLTVRNLDRLIRTLFGEGRSLKKGEKIPPYFSAIIAAPYTEGFEFVKNIICVSGWDTVNQIYRDLPDSTEQILHYEKYLFTRDFPCRIKLSKINDELGGWKKIEENTMGELQMKIVFNYFFPAIDKSSAHAGWGGDLYRLYTRDGKYFGLWFTTWDTPQDAAEFYKTYRKVLDRKYPGLKIGRETTGKSLEGAAASGMIAMEKRDKSVAVIEKIPKDIYPGLMELMWSAEITRPEHPIKVKGDPAKRKIKAPSSVAAVQSSGGSARVDGNTYTNSYYGFSLQKPERWVFQTREFNSSCPVYVSDMETGAFLSMSIAEASTPLNDTLLEYQLIAAGNQLCDNFEKGEKGTANVGGYFFSYAKGTGIEKKSQVPCELRGYGAEIKNRLFLLVYMVPSSYAEQAEPDFNSIIQSMRFE